MTNEEEVKQKIEVFTQFMRGMFNNPNLYVPKDMADKYGISEEFCEKKENTECGNQY